MSKIISGRHVRHDWRTFVDWEQNSVKALCGVTTRRGLAGIPGITEQPRIVEAGPDKRWGWCAPCLREVMYWLQQYKDYCGNEHVDALYQGVYDEIEAQWHWITEGIGREYRRRLAGTSVNL